MVAASELPVQTVREGVDAEDMANAIFGDGVQIVGATYTGDIDSAGIYWTGDAVADSATPSDTGVILSTGNAEDYTNSSGSNANQSGSTSTNTSGQNNNSQFNAAAGSQTYDAAYLDVDFIATGDTMTMQFVFSSEEYPEFQNSIYQDFVGVWINGQQVDISVGNGDSDPGNINNTNNENLYVDNTASIANTEMDGLTVTLTLTFPVLNDGSVNSIRIGIADVSDSSYDSNLLIAGDSVQTSLIARDDLTHLTDPNGSKTVNVISNDTGPNGAVLEVTHINGVRVYANDVVNLNSGQTVRLNPDGTIEVIGDGDSEDFNFTYTMTDGVNSDVGIVNVSSIPCFVAGTLIDTPDGPRPVEAIASGDLVLTRDDGPQPVRWAGARTVEAEGAFAPVAIAAGALGAHAALMLSPEHRVLVAGSTAELLFGEREVLVAAKHLVDGRAVTQQAGGEVTYVHLMFDRHQVVTTEGLASESFLPGPQTRDSFEADVLNEICAIFPELDPDTGEGYGPAARRLLRGYEAGLLAKARAA
ncbi:MAG: Hint domain-containing protein [Pseudomonadota bacterium]